MSKPAAAFACACMGPGPGEPACPCVMRQAGLVPACDKLTAEVNDRLKDAFWGGGCHPVDTQAKE